MATKQEVADYINEFEMEDLCGAELLQRRSRSLGLFTLSLSRFSNSAS